MSSASDDGTHSVKPSTPKTERRVSCTSQPSSLRARAAVELERGRRVAEHRSGVRAEDADQRHVVEPGDLDVVDDAVTLEVAAYGLAAVGGQLEPQPIVETMM